MTRKTIAFGISAVAMVISMLWLDVPVAQWINAHQTSSMKSVGLILEEIGRSHWILGYCVVMTIIAWRSMRSLAHKHLALFASVAISGIAANIIKVIACRPRPPLLIERGITDWNLFGFQMDYIWNSFPSGHATTGLAIAISGSTVYPRLRWLFWIVGIAIALGRVMLNAHYLSDIIAGGMLGGVVAYGILRYTPKPPRNASPHDFVVG
ncbi:MAG: phosphatase PAP2 family protein [Ignavibacteria bacterium]|nr:phosphatase PAP2 family protein [Ignavibacteria bacterium]